jgi:putative membrane protein insertion efficiency factor
MVLLGLIWVYRSAVGPMVGGRCRFHPSCSAYAAEAVRVHGAVKGVMLSVWRVLRCSPLTPGGPDPVPQAGSWRPRSPETVV